MKELTEEGKKQLYEVTGSDHFPDPTWSKFYSKLECKVCGKEIVGEGTLDNPWIHKGPEEN